MFCPIQRRMDRPVGDRGWDIRHLKKPTIISTMVHWNLIIMFSKPDFRYHPTLDLIFNFIFYKATVIKFLIIVNKLLLQLLILNFLYRSSHQCLSHIDFGQLDRLVPLKLYLERNKPIKPTMKILDFTNFQHASIIIITFG